MQANRLFTMTEAGLYCPAGDFFIDPWNPVPTAIITHAHSDHARFGSDHYIANTHSEAILRARLGNIRLESQPYREKFRVGSAWVSLHPAGHILGASQVRVEVDGYVAVVTGDYKRQPDATCEPFEVVECDLLVTESTFGLPVFRWPDMHASMEAIHRWWRRNQAAGKTSVLAAYALGKSQRLLANLDPSIGPIVVHGAIQGPNEIYRKEGVTLPETWSIHDLPKEKPISDCLVLTVPSSLGTPWLKRFGDVSLAMASGWMAIRGTRRRRGVDRGFVVSDHVDWPDLLRTVEESKAKTIWVTHGFSHVVARYLSELGYDARPLATRFQGEVEEEPASDAIPSAEPSQASEKIV
jgi:putative mRNA 3-end processing factor